MAIYEIKKKPSMMKAQQLRLETQEDKLKRLPQISVGKDPDI